ncbi:LysR substrate-binding domain-containing protein [Cellulomonas alba]|uniref:LysR substrate-binding domain-containing protein n=1 Tax=Cellulomonas alba TaxID=3053467 RepID=A0ABT7SGC5_9CELL|nr:LysR substrate-binding domain-containing protein [Cellulomonas alba]MDM7855231.1 LysR substrate-binding domain-containing protein [Cellulomonas alba]
MSAPEPATTPGTGAGGTAAFRVGIVPGVNPDRWLRVWRERLADVPLELVQLEATDAEARLRAADADVALVRLPVDRDGLAVIPLYTEATVVLVARDNVLTAADELTPGDLVDDTVLVDATLTWDDAPGERFAGAAPATTEEAVDLVAAGLAVLVAPQSVARLHQRKGLAVRPVPDAPGSQVGLAWLETRYDDLVEEFIGIVRGRTAASSRGRGAPPADEKARTPRPTGGGRAPAQGRGAGKGRAPGKGRGDQGRGRRR